MRGPSPLQLFFLDQPNCPFSVLKDYIYLIFKFSYLLIDLCFDNITCFTVFDSCKFVRNKNDFRGFCLPKIFFIGE